MIKLPRDRHGNEGWIVRARKQHRCQMGWSHRDCLKTIEPGTNYYRAIAWPGHVANEGPAPWVMRICRKCINDEQRQHFEALETTA